MPPATGQAVINFDYEPPGPTLARFFESDDFARCIMGPMHGGRRVACIYDVVLRSGTHPDQHHWRWAAIRATLDELEKDGVDPRFTKAMRELRQENRQLKEQFGGIKYQTIGSWDLIAKPFWYGLFKFLEKDFKLDFGTPEPFGDFAKEDTAILAFLAYYLEDEAKAEYLQEGRYKIEYPAFDWSLNDWRKGTP